METTNGTLLLRVRDQRDATAWREFDRIYRPLLLRYARARGVEPTDAEDIAQQCMASISKQMPQFDYLSGKGRFKAWLRKIVYHKVIDQLRRRKETIARTRDFDRPDSGADTPDDIWANQWETEHLRYCLRQIRRDLPARTYDMFHLYAIEDKSADEVAELLGVTRNQVWITKTRVLKTLRNTMTDLFGDEQANY